MGAVGALPPQLSLVIAAEILEHGSVGVEQRGAPRKGDVRVELRDLELGERLLGLDEVEAGTGHRDGEFHLYLDGQGGTRHGTPKLEGTVRTAESPLAVHHHGQLVVAARDTSIRAQLAKGEGEVAARIGGDRERLTHDRDAPGTTSGRDGMAVGKDGVGVDETSGHHHVAGHLFRILLAQGLEL